MTDTKLQRINMVESQVRPSDVTDRRIIRAMLEVPREPFVAESLQALAYMDQSVPVATSVNGGGPPRALLAPRTFAKLVQLAAIEPNAVVLDVGCATGYATAVLARLAKAVIAIESDHALAERARTTLKQLGVGNVVVIEGALEKGASSHAPFDAILLGGAVPQVPDELLGQLRNGARLVGVLADGGFGRAQAWHRNGKTFDARPAFDAGAEMLPGFARKAEFAL
jgi:protein-L-isoaspartate(D-aspartate) O-methyltransferase